MGLAHLHTKIEARQLGSPELHWWAYMLSAAYLIIFCLYNYTHAHYNHYGTNK